MASSSSRCLADVARHAKVGEDAPGGADRPGCGHWDEVDVAAAPAGEVRKAVLIGADAEAVAHEVAVAFAEMIFRRNRSAFLRHHLIAALNFQLTTIIGTILSTVLTFALIGFQAAIAASRGEFCYPISQRLFH